MVGEFGGGKGEGAGFEWVVAWSRLIEDHGVNESKMTKSDTTEQTVVLFVLTYFVRVISLVMNRMSEQCSCSGVWY